MFRGIKKWISDMFYAQYIASYSEAGYFKEAKRLAQERFGKGKAKDNK